MADILVQRFEVNATNQSTQNITAVSSLNNAFVRIVGASIKGSGGPTGSTANAGPNAIACFAYLETTSRIRFETSAASAVKVMVEVWEYTGDPGGEYEFIVRDRGESLIFNVSSDTENISGISDRNKCVPIYNGFTSNENSTSDYEATALAMHINASNQLVVSRGNNGGGGVHTARWVVVEFTGSAWRVGHAVDTSHDTIGTGGKSVTLNTDSTGTGGSTFDVTDWSTAMILDLSMGGDGGGETGLADCLIVADPGSTTTTVDIRMGDNNARNDDTVYVHVIQCDDLVVNRYENNNYSENNGGATYGATQTVSGANGSTPMSELALEWSCSTTGTGTAWARGCLTAELTSSTQFRSWVHRSGNNVMVRAGIVDFSGLTPSAGGGVTVSLGSQSYTKSLNSITASTTASVTASMAAVSFALGLNPIVGSASESVTATLANQNYTLTQNSLTTALGSTGDLGTINYVQALNAITVGTTGATNVPVGLQNYSLGINPLTASASENINVSLGIQSYTIGQNSLDTSLGTTSVLNALNYSLGLNPISISVGGSITVNLSLQNYTLGQNSITPLATQNTTTSLGVLNYTIGQNSITVSGSALVDLNIPYTITQHPLTTSISGGTTVVLSNQNYALGLNELRAGTGVSFSIGIINYTQGLNSLTTSLGQGSINSINTQGYSLTLNQLDALLGSTIELGQFNYLITQNNLGVTTVQIIPETISIISRITKQLELIGKLTTEKSIISEITKEVELVGRITKEVSIVSRLTKEIEFYE